jgi:hypothetical protein
MLRILAARGERYMDAEDLAAVLGKKPSGGHWNSGIAVLRNNGLIETEPAPRRREAGATGLPRSSGNSRNRCADSESCRR